MTTATVTPVQPGDVVDVVDEQYVAHKALVTTVHGKFAGEGGGYVPLINVVYVSLDPLEHDPYGQQVKRLSSLAHLSTGPDKMPKPGRYWANAAV